MTDWYRVAGADELPDGRVKTVVAGTKWLVLIHFKGQYRAMNNHCPHQGGPLGEGSIECGADNQYWLRCPWHGWDFDPLTGKPPGSGHEDKGQVLYPVEVREDGIYVGLEPAPPRETTISDLMAETLTNWGIRSVFGMVGHSNLGLADALREQELKGRLRYIGIRHEGAAAFACSGYAKLTGSPAACLSIAGPGATNLLTGLWDAKVDRAPVVALTGQVRVQVFGPGVFQDIDLAAAFAPVAHFSKTVLNESRHVELANLACKTAIVERNVSHLIFPDDIQTLPAKPGTAAGKPDGRVAAADIRPSEDLVKKAAKTIAEAKRPLIICGYGARGSMDEIVALAERLGCPIATTFKAKGQISDQHPLAAGVMGRSGTPIASWFMNESDLLIVFGSSFSDHTGISSKKRTIQVDFDRMVLGKMFPVDLPIWAEISAAADSIGAALPAKLAAPDRRAEIAERWGIWRAEKARRTKDDNANGVNSAVIFAELSELVDANAIIAVDVGNNTYSFGRYFECREQSVLMSGYLGSIGFGFPAAMGAWAATQDFAEHKNRQVIALTGDGGYGQYLTEFNTAVKYKMNLTHILLNNGQLGKITKEQQSGEWNVWQTGLSNPDFAQYAELCGGLGIRVTQASQLRAAIKKALAYDGPATVEIISDAELV